MMRSLPRDIGLIHFIGIGGIGMSGIAEILHNLGYRVQGSDIAAGGNVSRLQALGVPVTVGHDAANLGEAAVVVVSSAVRGDNPELAAARAQRLPVVRRAEMLAELMRLKWAIAVGGTHGKTTTTSLVAAMLDRAGLDPTVINGGIINAWGSNARLGASDWMVAEADESDGTFERLPATAAVVTNIDPEHLDHYGSFDALLAAFQRFIDNLPFYGFAALCLDHPQVQALIPRLADRRVITYGFASQADIRGADLRAAAEGVIFDVEIAEHVEEPARRLTDIALPMFGRHNVLNALAAIAVAVEMGLPEPVIREALAGFGGVARRFTRTGVARGVTVIDDYAHHPVEIMAVLEAARAASRGRVIAVMQPHRYSRLRDLFEEFCTCFNEADTVLIAPVHGAGEMPLIGMTGEALAAGVRRHGHRDARAIPEPGPAGARALAPAIAEITAPGDVVLCMGAGTITRWATDLPAALAALDADGPKADGPDADGPEADGPEAGTPAARKREERA